MASSASVSSIVGLRQQILKSINGQLYPLSYFTALGGGDLLDILSPNTKICSLLANILFCRVQDFSLNSGFKNFLIDGKFVDTLPGVHFDLFV